MISPYLSSSPPSLRTIFRSEKTVPKMSFASSSAVNGARFPLPGAVPLLNGLTSEAGREDLLETDDGRGSQRRL